MPESAIERTLRDVLMVPGALFIALGLSSVLTGGGSTESLVWSTGVGIVLLAGGYSLYNFLSRSVGMGNSKTGDSKRKSNSISCSSPSGSVYVLTNPEMPNLVKIGHTTRTAAKRAKELSGTGVPGEYKVAYEIPVDHPRQVERRVHHRLSDERISRGEFFKVSPKRAAREIKRVAS